MRTNPAGIREVAVALATQYRLVTPISGAVVLETRQQYEESRLAPVSQTTVPTIPEPHEWVLLLMADAPCSGVNMLWAGLLLTLMGCVLLRLGVLKVVMVVAISLVLAVASNVLRGASLFYVEAGLIPQAQHWWHDGIGIIAFGLSAVAILCILTRLHRGEAIRCRH